MPSPPTRNAGWRFPHAPSLLCYSTPMVPLQMATTSQGVFSRARHGVPDPPRTGPPALRACITLRLLVLLTLSGLEHPLLVQAAAAHSPPAAEVATSGQDWPVILARVRSNALAYSDQLPDFICNQTTQLFVRSVNLALVWRKTSSFVAALSFYDKKEHYEILSVNQEPAPGATMENLTGGLSIGEFGSALRGLFELRTQAEFHPIGFKKINNLETLCIAFKVSRERSRRFISYNDRTIMTAYSGRCWVTPVDYQIVRLEKKSVGIPRDFPVTRFDMSVDYAAVTISDASYWLPKKAEIWISHRPPGDYSNLTSSLMQTKSKLRFDGYRRFGAGVKLVTE